MYADGVSGRLDSVWPAKDENKEQKLAFLRTSPKGSFCYRASTKDTTDDLPKCSEDRRRSPEDGLLTILLFPMTHDDANTCGSL